jgi:hypothetical protein
VCFIRGELFVCLSVCLSVTSAGHWEEIYCDVYCIVFYCIVLYCTVWYSVVDVRLLCSFIVTFTVMCVVLKGKGRTGSLHLGPCIRALCAPHWNSFVYSFTFTLNTF